jgi:4-amino-4-deoxy-L-arabinose transferase-like glycosyltransferase
VYSYKYLCENEKLFLFILFTILLFRLVALNAYPLMDTTEARYAEIAREMVVTNNWITPQLDLGQPFWAKPPLSIWATALCFKLFGISEFTARLSSFVFSILSLFFTFMLAEELLDRKHAILTSVILASTGLFYVLLGAVMTDQAFSFGITLAIVSFVLNLKGKNKFWGYLFFIGIGISVLSKGLLGLFFILVPIATWKLTFKKATQLPWVYGTLLFLLISVPWHVAAEMKTPGFLNYYIVGEHFARFVVPGWKGDMFGHAHSEPKGMIWLFLVLGASPWIIVFTLNIYRCAKDKILKSMFLAEDWLILNFMWFIFPAVFFTFAGNIIMTYTLPSLPPLAILTAYSIKNYPYKNNKTILVSVLLVPVLFNILSYTVISNRAVNKTQKKLANTFIELNKNGYSSLIYLYKMPYSGDFYSEGRGIEIKDSKYAYEYLSNNKKDYFAIRNEDEPTIPENIKNKLHKIYDFGKYSLYEEIQNP